MSFSRINLQAYKKAPKSSKVFEQKYKISEMKSLQTTFLCVKNDKLLNTIIKIMIHLIIMF